MAVLPEIEKKYFFMVLNGNIHNIGISDISASCPVCNEGNSKGRKFRFHLFVHDSYDAPIVKCFNCEYSSNMYGFLKEFYINEYKLYVNEKKTKSFISIKDIMKNDIKIEKKNNIIIKKPLLFNPISSFIDFKQAPIKVKDYIIQRGIYETDLIKDWKYSNKDNSFIFNNKKVILSEYIIIPFIKDKKWYGFQAIAWKEKKFFIYIKEGNSGYKIWNFFNINKNEPVYIFESVFDALSSGLKNVISVNGVNIDEKRLKELKKPVFCLDNFRVDEKAKELTEFYAKQNYNIFIWPKGSEKFKDTNDLRKKGISFSKIKNMIISNIFSELPAILRLYK